MLGDPLVEVYFRSGIVGKPEVIVGSNDTSRFPEISTGAVGAGGMGEVYRVRAHAVLPTPHVVLAQPL